VLTGEFEAGCLRRDEVSVNRFTSICFALRRMVNHEAWSLDLAYAASRQWLPYLHYQKRKLAKLSDDERNFILGCCFSSRVVSRPSRPWIFSMSGVKEQTVDLLLEHGPVQSPHVAIYLESVAHLEPPQFLQRRLVNEDADFASVLKQPYVTEHEMD